MATVNRNTEQPHLRDEENIPPTRNGAAIKSSNQHKSRPKGKENYKRKADDTALLASAPRKRARYEGDDTDKTPAASRLKTNKALRAMDDEGSTCPRHEQGPIEQASSDTTSVRHSPAEQNVTDVTYPASELKREESATDEDPNQKHNELHARRLHRDAEKNEGLPSMAPSIPLPTKTTVGTLVSIKNPQQTVRAGLSANQPVIGMEKLKSGHVADRGSAPNHGPAGHHPEGRDTSSRGLDRIIKEAVAAPRQPLPLVLGPRPFGRHPLPTEPVKKG